MLEITIPDIEAFNEATCEFIEIKGQTIKLEHSLVSLSKWESKWNKPFLSKEQKSREETIDYIKCMTITQNVNDNLYNYIPDSYLVDINNYIAAPMTATTFNEKERSSSREIITAEIIYYWMVTFNIPFECQKWHLNKLLALVKVCSIKNAPEKKRSKNDISRDYKSINAARRQALNTKG